MQGQVQARAQAQIGARVSTGTNKHDHDSSWLVIGRYTNAQDHANQTFFLETQINGAMSACDAAG